MILRLFRARVRPGADAELLRRLRGRTIPEIQAEPAVRAFSYGFRRDGCETHHLAVSTWTDIGPILARAGSLDRPVVTTATSDIFDAARIDHFELVEPVDSGKVAPDGAVIGVVVAQVAPNADATALDLVRAVRDEVREAGVVALHVGRRVLERHTELVVLAVWRDRASLRAFAQRRERRVIDRRFLDQLTSWSFETWDCLSQERLLVPPAGPAILIADETGRYVDASPGIEAVLGIPGELILHRSVAELTAPSQDPGFEESWAAFARDGYGSGTYDLVVPGGRAVRVRFRAERDVPSPGLHASLLRLPEDPDDGRPLADLVAEAIGGVPAPPPAPVAAAPRPGTHRSASRSARRRSAPGDAAELSPSA